MPRIVTITCLLACLSASAFGQFGSNTARRIISGTTAPSATCNAGPVDVYVRTGGVSAGLYLCLSSNTWTGPLGTGSVTGTLATGGNPGPVPYVSAANTLSEDATNFCWDATNHRLGISNNGTGCAPGGGLLIDAEFNSGSGQGIKIANANAAGAYLEAAASGGTQIFMISSPTGSCNSLGACGQIYTGTAAPLEFGTGSVNQMFLQSTGEFDIGTPTAAGAAIKLNTNGDSKQIHTIAGGTAPTISGTTGGGTSQAITGADENGRVTVGSSVGTNAIIVLLGQTYTNAPGGCKGTDETRPSTEVVECVATTSQITLFGFSRTTGAATNFTAADAVSWSIPHSF